VISLTITNPLATRPLLRSMIEKKERARPEYIEILQGPTTLRNSTSDIAAGCIISPAATEPPTAPPIRG
jgi:hypothetical protein